MGIRGLFEGWHLVILLVVIVLLFGAKRLPDASRAIGKSMRIFKSEVKELTNSDDDEDDKPSPSPSRDRTRSDDRVAASEVAPSEPVRTSSGSAGNGSGTSGSDREDREPAGQQRV